MDRRQFLQNLAATAASIETLSNTSLAGTAAGTDGHSVTTGWFTLLGLDAEHRLGVTLDNVSVYELRPGDVRAENAKIRLGPRRGNLVPSGTGVSVTDAGAGPGAPLSCDIRLRSPYPDPPGGERK